MYFILMTNLFIGANLDFFILLIPLINKHGIRNATIGYILGVVGMYFISVTLGQVIQLIFPTWAIGVLGIIPIWFGVRGREEEMSDRNSDLSILAVTFLYLTACSADNIALYVPVLSGLTIEQSIFYGLYFILLASITSILAYCISNIKVVKCLFDRFEDLITRIIYILIGLFVVIESGLLEKMLFLLAPILKIIYF